MTADLDAMTGPAYAPEPLDAEDFTALYGKAGTDVDRAEYAARKLAGRLMYCEGPGWYAWDGRVWVNDSTRDAVARRKVHELSAELLRYAADTQAANGRDAIEAAQALRSSHRISALLTELQAMPGIRRSVAELDGPTHLLSFSNGTVDLRDGAIRPHDPADLLTRLVDVEYDPDAPAEEWESFLTSCHPDDPEMPGFLRRLAGYAITGETREECLAFFYGSGANGKGAFTETLSHHFADITTTQDAAFWEKQRHERNGSLMAKLHGARLVVTGEVKAARMDEAFVKGFTAADLQTANQKYKPAYDFRPVSLLIMSGNDKPVIEGTDEGIWRRFRLVPWEESFADRPDKGLKPRLKSAQAAPGIAAWAVRGAVEWHAEGLRPHQRISEATNDYREESDPFAEWAEGAFEAAPDGAVSNKEIEASAKAYGLRGQGRKFSDAVLRHVGGERPAKAFRHHGRAVRGLRGVRLREDSAAGRYPNILAEV
ncbi:phage/plasmid primase, P4 family [Kitasatospora sp. NPDC101183]|uniref:DNA primase family protein n=1 Tax=Kitasatospora sp. NPDC101183 TaxID=3364100 RepID=UPI00382D3168